MYAHIDRYARTQKLEGKKHTEAIFNFTKCNALLFFYSTGLFGFFKLGVIY